MPARLPILIRIWFALAIFVALFPPIHWAASGADPVFGVPRSLAYLFGVSVFAAAGLAAAYGLERKRA